MDVLSCMGHRSSPFRYGPWIMQQRWHDLLFAHWPVDVSTLRAAVPAKLSIDTFDGQAWLGIVVFRLSGVKLRGLPEIKAVASFPEVNVRTYVTYNGRPGVYFMSLDADNPLAIALARPWFRLNYYNSHINFRADKKGIQFKSRRIERGASEARLAVNYAPLQDAETCEPGFLEHWLTDRHCYYTSHKRRVFRCDIEHGQWPLQRATATFCENSMAAAQGVTLPTIKPLLHFVPYMEAHIWPLRSAESGIRNAELILRSLRGHVMPYETKVREL